MNFALAALLFIYVSWLICIFAINLIYYWLHKQDTGNDHMKELAISLKLAQMLSLGVNSLPSFPSSCARQLFCILKSLKETGKSPLEYSSGAVFLY